MKTHKLINYYALFVVLKQNINQAAVWKTLQ